MASLMQPLTKSGPKSFRLRSTQMAVSGIDSRKLARFLLCSIPSIPQSWLVGVGAHAYTRTRPRVCVRVCAHACVRATRGMEGMEPTLLITCVYIAFILAFLGSYLQTYQQMIFVAKPDRERPFCTKTERGRCASRTAHSPTWLAPARLWFECLG